MYPEASFKIFWDLFLGGVLIFSCTTTPYRIALVEVDSIEWVVANVVVDVLFLMDILLIFNTAYYDEDFVLVDSHKQIAKAYCKGWFAIDVLAILPFDFLLDSAGDFNDIVRVARIGRLYKLVKLIKLLRLFRLIRERKKMMKQVGAVMRINVALERLTFFFVSFLLTCHVTSCFWILTASFEADSTASWIDGGGYRDFDNFQLYLTSFYFTITTITTVGYGDISGGTAIEKVYCVLVMLIGVLAFSVASGTLTSILSNYDTQNAEFQEQLQILNKLYQEYQLPLRLYSKLKQSLKLSSSRDLEEQNQFFERLPQNLQNELAVFLYQQTQKDILFLRDKSTTFITWICPLLRPYIVTEKEYVYFEGDAIQYVYFLKSGEAGFVLPKHNNFKYIDINTGHEFGMLDVIGSILQADDGEGVDDRLLEDLTYQRDKLKRQFTVMAFEETQVLLLSIQDLNRMRMEFVETYEEMLEAAKTPLQIALIIKLKAMTHC